MGNLGVTQIDSARVKQSEEQKKQLPRQTKQQSVSFFDEAWSGHQIAKLTGDNVFTDWLQNKDKVCTDGKDDGKLSVGQYALSFAKGLIGGIPKAIINHPLATAVTVGVGAAAVALTGGAILPVLGAIGVATGVGMAGYGTYKAVTAKKDGDAKQALETMGMGVTTTALSMKSAGKMLEKAAEAGVKSAQVSKDANIFQKTWQMFKSIPESLTKSKEWTMSYVKGTPVNIELADGTKQVKVKGKLVEETFENGSYKKYDADGNFIEGKIIEGNKTSIIKDGQLVSTREELSNGGYKLYDGNGTLTEGKINEGNKISIIKEGQLVSTREELSNGGYKLYDGNGTLIEGKIIEGNKVSFLENGKLVKYSIRDGKMETIYNPEGSISETIFHKYEHVTITTKYNPDGTKTEIFNNIYHPYNKVSTFDKLGRLIKFEDGYSTYEYYYQGDKKVAEYFTTPYSHRSSVTIIYDGTADLSAVKRGAVLVTPSGVQLEGYEFGKPLPNVDGRAAKVVINPDGRWRAYDSNGENIQSWGLSLEEHKPSALAIFGHEPHPGMTHNGKPVYATRDFSPSEIEAMKNRGYKEGGGLFSILYKD